MICSYEGLYNEVFILQSGKGAKHCKCGEKIAKKVQLKDFSAEGGENLIYYKIAKKNTGV